MRDQPALLSALTRVLALMLGLAVPLTCVGQEEVDVRFSGFATFALTSNDSDSMGFRATGGHDLALRDGDIDHRSDSRIGLQWNIRWNAVLDSAVQVVIDHTARAHDSDYLDWAFLRYRVRDGSELRVGRLGLDVFMLSDYRQIGYTYPWVRPPMDFYGPIALYSMDGIDYQQRFDTEDGALYAKLFAGRSHYHAPGRNGDHQLDLSPIIGFTLLYESEPWKARLSHTELKFSSEVDTQLLADGLIAYSAIWPDAPYWAQEVLVEDTKYRYSAIGGGYDDNIWSIQAELGEVSGDRALLPDSKHAYLSVARRFGELTLFTVFGKARPNNDPVSISLPPTIPPPLLPLANVLRDSTVYIANRSRMDQDSVGVGLRWDFASRMALKLQWDRYRVHADGTGLWHPVAAEPGTANVATLSFDMLF